MQEEHPALTFGRQRCGQSVPEFAFSPHIIIKTSPDLFRWLTEHCGMKCAPWPLPVDTVMLDDFKETPESDPPFGAWGNESGQAFLQERLSTPYFMLNNYAIVDAQLDETLLMTAIPDYVIKFHQLLLLRLPLIADQLGFAGVPLDENCVYVVLVFSKKRRSECEALTTWAKEKSITWGVMIPNDNPVDIEGSIFHLWGYTEE